MNMQPQKLLTLAVGLTLAALIAFTGTAYGQDVDPTALQDFNSKVRERNTLLRQLHRLDGEALHQAAKGEPMIITQARMQTLQDKLMTVETRLTIMSSRLGVDIPSPPVLEPPVDEKTIAPADRLARDSKKLAPDGVARTNKVFERKAITMANQLKFHSYPTYLSAEDK